MCLLPPKSETPSVPGVVIRKTPGMGTTEAMYPIASASCVVTQESLGRGYAKTTDLSASALTPGTTLFRGDYDPSRDVLRVLTGRVREVRGCTVIVEDATGVESLDYRYVFGWHASEREAVAALKARLMQRLEQAEDYRARFILGIGRCNSMLGGK